MPVPLVPPLGPTFVDFKAKGYHRYPLVPPGV
jgi:hypothetical protein